jgi:hypothetical protein
VAINNGYSSGIISYSLDEKIRMTFSFNNFECKDYLVIQFEPKFFMLSKNDTISFLFENDEIASFKFEINSYKIAHPFIEKYFENKTLITIEDLNLFQTKKFTKWKIRLDKSNNEVIGGNKGFFNYEEHNNLVLAINKFTNEYCSLVKAEIINYSPLSRNTQLVSRNQVIEYCSVYLMIDTVNFYYKIGISNNPDWREKTLQSEKPTIELIACKKFINRKIALSFEKALHDTYSEKRIRGEWFKLDNNDVEDLIITLKE